MNGPFLQQVDLLETYCSALNSALPALREAGETLKDDALKARVEQIGVEYGFAELF